MDTRKILAYGFAAALLLVGVRMMLAEDVVEAPSAASITELGPQRGAGYNGRGTPQVQFDGQFATDPDAGAKRAEPSALQLARQRAAEERGPELEKVLQNLGGEPVYVQGVDDVTVDED
jgi:hypothetical protein